MRRARAAAGRTREAARLAALAPTNVRAASGSECPRAAPALGADTDALLGDLGYSAERIAGLRSRRAVR